MLGFTVDESQWRGAFWTFSVNILEHSGCSGGSPGALCLNNILLYIDIIYIITAIICVRLQTILWISNDCVGFCDISGSSTSTLIWSRLNLDMEEKGFVSSRSPTAEAPPPPPQWAAPWRWCLAAVRLRRETIVGNNPFLLHLALHVVQGVEGKVPSPQFLLHHGWENPHSEFCCGNTIDVREPDAA